MKYRLVVVALSAVMAFGSFCARAETSGSAMAPSVQMVPQSFADIAEKLVPAVVNISTSQDVEEQPEVQEFKAFPPGHPFEEFNEFFERFGYPYGGDQEMTSLGSGFIISEDGLIVTNNHVIEDADKVHVTLQDDSKFEAEVVGHDPKTDLALLRIKAGKKLPFVTFGDSDQSRVGDWILAIGNPFGLGGTVTTGIISARARDINSGPFDDFLQTDAAINRGNSGGPMFNLQGQVIGINTAIYSPSGGGNVGIGFAVPSSMAEPVIAQLRDKGKVERGWLGVKIQKITEEIAEGLGIKEQKGALVAEVVENSPAEKAGILQGDIILEFDGKEITDMRKLPRLVAETEIGRTTTVKLLRKNDIKELEVEVGKLDETQEEASVDQKQDKKIIKGDKQTLGMVLQPMSDELRKKFQIDESINGLVVAHVNQNSGAFRRGIREGDVLIEANQDLLESVDDFRRIVKSVKESGRSSILVLVYREKETLYVPLPFEKEKPALQGQ